MLEVRNKNAVQDELYADSPRIAWNRYDVVAAH
jgi:hypothetical protein